MYIVICRDDDQDGQPGPYKAATDTLFMSEIDAMDYEAGIADSRGPRVVSAEQYLHECLGWEIK